MKGELRSRIPILLPRVTQWAEVRSAAVARSGRSLSESEMKMARFAEVAYPERVRIGLVEKIPYPDDPVLRKAAMQAGLLGPGTLGLTLGYSILVCEDHFTPRLLSHELRHVYQYEQAGSIADFLPVYLDQILEFGYDLAPLEVDARQHEVKDD